MLTVRANVARGYEATTSWKVDPWMERCQARATGSSPTSRVDLGPRLDKIREREVIIPPDNALPPLMHEAATYSPSEGALPYSSLGKSEISHCRHK